MKAKKFQTQNEGSLTRKKSKHSDSLFFCIHSIRMFIFCIRMRRKKPWIWMYLTKKALKWFTIGKNRMSYSVCDSNFIFSHHYLNSKIKFEEIFSWLAHGSRRICFLSFHIVFDTILNLDLYWEKRTHIESPVFFFILIQFAFVMLFLIHFRLFISLLCERLFVDLLNNVNHIECMRSKNEWKSVLRLAA